jgi:hypothetical protein
LHPCLFSVYVKTEPGPKRRECAVSGCVMEATVMPHNTVMPTNGAAILRPAVGAGE